MKKLALVVDERELSTLRAALHLLQEQADALPEDLAEMMAAHGKPMTESELEHLSLRLDGATSPNPEYPQRIYSPLDRTVELERFNEGTVPQAPA
jgi:hypothetical protein